MTRSPDDELLKRLQKYKGATVPQTARIGTEIIHFFKQSVDKRQGKLTTIVESLNQLIPPTLLEHCAVDSLTRGTLRLLVDSPSHLYDLKSLLLAGLEKQLLLACKTSGLRKVTLRQGRFD